jgi:hypothetical protein
MVSHRFLHDERCWRISNVRTAEEFFRAVPQLIPEATHMFLEGSPSGDVVAALKPHLEDGEYAAPIGTLWALPRNQRLRVGVSAALLGQLAETAKSHAEPEICTHLHFYRDDEPLVQWFDAFDDPVNVSKLVPRESVERFCAHVHGALIEARD